MALTITLPDEVRLTDDQIVISVNATNLLDVVGVFGQFNLRFASLGVANDTFTLQIFSAEYEFKFVASPDDSGLQLTSDPGATTLLDWLAIIKVDIEKNYIINKYYDVTVGAPNILNIRNKEVIDVTNLYIPGPAYMNTTTDQDGVASVRKDFYEIGFIIEYYDTIGAEWIEIAERRIVPVSTVDLPGEGDSALNIAELLKPFLYPDWDIKTSKIIVIHNNAMIKYRLKYFESFGNPQVNQGLFSSAGRFALDGGFSKFELASLNDNSYNFWNRQITVSKMFLSWAEKTRTIAYESRVNMFFPMWETTQLCNQKIKGYFTTGLDATVTVTSLSLTQYAMYELVMSPSIINLLGTFPGQVVVKFDIWIEKDAGSVRISEIRTFNINTDYKENRRSFRFLNSFGVWDDWDFYGLGIKGADYIRTPAVNFLQLDFSQTDRENITVQVNELETFVVNTGWISEAEVNFLREMLLSKDVREFTLRASGIVDETFPVNITNANVILHHDNDYLYSLEIEYMHGVTDNHYSRKMDTA